METSDQPTWGRGLAEISALSRALANLMAAMFDVLEMHRSAFENEPA